jgi:hypothetical protein
MKPKSVSDAGLQEDNNVSVIPSSIPSAIPVIAVLSNQIDTVNKSENQDLEVRELAYRLYQERGCIEGQALHDWLDAEAIVKQGEKLAA